ncbi:hypothetical protein [Actinomadura opuntiae]|uniref:hypothetical protein n=1 Tax=Actinomadura sp. OS1-43 TaxID=604315 RepID=UPI00255B3390|nr:hypothetical protein [Actinomadura sp. OS1-43]MDL4812767.1 hypothetical protein [Actinomadura sp. OS1-43]
MPTTPRPAPLNTFTAVMEWCPALADIGTLVVVVRARDDVDARNRILAVLGASYGYDPAFREVSDDPSEWAMVGAMFRGDLAERLVSPGDHEVIRDGDVSDEALAAARRRFRLG